MPRTVYERRKGGVEYPVQRPLVPSGYAFIEHGPEDGPPLNVTAGVKSNATAAGAFAWVGVYNMVQNSWMLLNRIDDDVDYSITNIDWDSALITINDWNSPDYLEYKLTLWELDGEGGDPITPPAGSPANPRIIPLADNTKTYEIPNLKSETWYRTDLIAKWDPSAGGGWTDSVIKEFRTTVNPTPLAPVLTYTNATNVDIDLAWTNPAGSTAVTYKVYAGVGQGAPWLVGNNGIDVMPTANKKWKAIWLAADTPYYYQVSGVNSSGMEGPKSNRVQVHTGHNEAWNSGFLAEVLTPLEVGSYRPDIAWKLWYARSSNNISVYQGYWQGDPRITGPTPIVIPSQESGRYWGCIRYNLDEFRARLNARYGAGTWESLDPTAVSVERVYRMRAPGSVDPQVMQWNIGWSDPFTGGRPSIIASFRAAGGPEGPDRIPAQDTLGAGKYIAWLRMPRFFAKALVSGWYQGNGINSLILFRADHINTGYGTAGYGEWAGHGQQDRSNAAYRTPDRYSSWNMHIHGNYSVKIRDYQGPYRW